MFDMLGTRPMSYPESSGSLVSGLVARRDSREMEFFFQKSGVPVVVRMLSFIKTEVNVSREVGVLDESQDGMPGTIQYYSYGTKCSF